MTSFAAGCPTPRSPRPNYTAFTSKKGKAITARLIVRRVKDLNRKAGEGQDELFTVWRYHAVFTDSPFETLQAEEQHRDHAIVEQVLRGLDRRPAGSPALGLVPRERGLAGPRRHQPQPAARRRVPGQPRLRQSPWRHAAPRPHRRRRPHRPPRPRRDHRAPARRLAPRARVDEPVRSRLRPARRGGLTSPDPVTAPPRPNGRRQATSIPGQNLWTSRRNVSGRKPTPAPAPRSTSSGPGPGNDHPNSRGGSRLRPAPDIPGCAPRRLAVTAPEDDTRHERIKRSPRL